MKKRIIATILMVAMVISVFAVPAFAVAKATDGKKTAAGKRIVQNVPKVSCPSSQSLKYIRLVYSKSKVSFISKQSSAIATMDAYKKAKRFHTGTKKIPIGAVVFGSGVGNAGSKYGHIGIYVGGGKIADVLHNKKAKWQTLSQWASWQTAKCRGHKGYIGWGW